MSDESMRNGARLNRIEEILGQLRVEVAELREEIRGSGIRAIERRVGKLEQVMASAEARQRILFALLGAVASLGLAGAVSMIVRMVS